MAKLPLIAIIGRPNTGKSTLFNRLVGKRKAIVSDVPGTTRDHIAHRIESEHVDYLLLDTGGMGGGSIDKDFEDDVDGQSLLGIEHADVIVFVINGQEELTAADYKIVEILRKKRKRHVPVILAASKMDNQELVNDVVPQLYALGIADEVIPISAPHRIGIDELTNAMEAKLQELKFGKQEEEKSSAPRIAIVGKPNAGKSSIINALMSDAQKKTSPLIVSDKAGTTRDATDTVINYHGKSFIFTDTAGLKKGKRHNENLEHYAMLRTIQAVEEADIVVVVLDASEPPTRQDKRIVGMAIEEGKGIMFMLNKIDLLKSEERKNLQLELARNFPFCRYAPLVLCSAITREGLLQMFDTFEIIAENRSRQIPTAALNRWFGDTTHDHPIKAVGKANYITQTDTHPPTFHVFVRDPKKISVSDLRFLDNRFREAFPSEGTPIRWVTKRK